MQWGSNKIVQVPTILLQVCPDPTTAHHMYHMYSGVMPGKSQNAVLQLYSIICFFAVSNLEPKQYKLS